MTLKEEWSNKSVTPHVTHKGVKLWLENMQNSANIDVTEGLCAGTRVGFITCTSDFWINDSGKAILGFMFVCF